MIFKNKILKSLIITIIIVVLVKLILPEHKSNQQITDEFWFHKTHGSTKYNIVVGGNSRIYRGVSIASLLEPIDNNLNGINLGYSSAGFSSEYLDFVFSRIDLKAEHKFVLLGITPGSLTEKAALNKHFNEIKNISETELLKKSYLTNFLSLEPYKPLELITIAQNQNGFIEEEKGYFSRYHKSGWVESYKLDSDSTEALPKYRKYYEPEEEIVSPGVVNVLLQKIEELVSQDIHVIAFRPPTTLQMEALEDSLLSFNEELFKQEIVAAGGIWLDFDSEDFNSYDGSHLHYLSAEKFSTQLGEVIQEISLTRVKLP